MSLMESLQRERLRELRDVVIPAIDPNRVNMESCECGTAACIAGWAAQHQNFERQGLHMEMGRWGQRHPVYKNTTCFDALESFFGLTGAQMYSIFSEDLRWNDDRPPYTGKRLKEGYMERQDCELISPAQILAKVANRITAILLRA